MVFAQEVNNLLGFIDLATLVSCLVVRGNVAQIAYSEMLTAPYA